MRTFLQKLSIKYNFIRVVIWKTIELRNVIIPLETRLKQRFKRTLGYSLDLDNPLTFNEKIQWLKINDRTPLHVLCSDKYAVRAYIKEKIGKEYLVPLVLHTTNVNDLTPEMLPDYPFIIKTNHDSGGGTIVRKKNDINWSEVRSQFKKRLSFNYDYGKGEWQYRDIPPCIIVEKLLVDQNGNIPSDYKMHFFNGQLAFTHVDMDRETDHKRNLYDIKWNFIPCTLLYKNGRAIEKPKIYNEMKRIGTILAKEFIYVRVDLYVVSDKIYFGELTFHHGSGNEIFNPQIWDRKIGDMLVLPK